MNRFSSQFSGTRGKRRQRSLVGMALAASALVVLPAAIALACVPASSIGFDKQGYKYNAGESVTVQGRGFRADTPVTMRLQAPSGSQSTVGTTNKTTDSTGGFSDSFALASDAENGSYVVSVTVGTGGARETFTVEPKAVDAPPPPPPNPFVAPPVTPTEAPPAGNTGADNTAARRTAVRRCQTTFRTALRKKMRALRRSDVPRTAARRTAKRQSARRAIVRQRNACVRAAQRRFP